MSTFSTFGPENDFSFKPAVSAPGGNIISTYPLALGGYAVASGTSMATPFVAGASALLLAAKGKTPAVARAARNLFETTATKVPSSLTDGDPYQTLTQAGAGLINAYDAIHGTTLVSTGELILNDTAHFKGMYVPIDFCIFASIYLIVYSHTFTVTNSGKTTKKYTLSHVPAGTALTVQVVSTRRSQEQIILLAKD